MQLDLKNVGLPTNLIAKQTEKPIKIVVYPYGLSNTSL